MLIMLVKHFLELEEIIQLSSMSITHGFNLIKVVNGVHKISFKSDR